MGDFPSEMWLNDFVLLLNSKNVEIYIIELKWKLVKVILNQKDEDFLVSIFTS